MSWLDNSSSEEEDDDDGQAEEEGGELEEEDPTDLEEQGNHCPVVLGSSKGKWSKRPTHRDDNNHGSGGL